MKNSACLSSSTLVVPLPALASWIMSKPFPSNHVDPNQGVFKDALNERQFYPLEVILDHPGNLNAGNAAERPL